MFLQHVMRMLPMPSRKSQLHVIVQGPFTERSTWLLVGMSCEKLCQHLERTHWVPGKRLSTAERRDIPTRRARKDLVQSRGQ